MQAVVMVPTLQGVAALAVVVKPGRPRNQEGDTITLGVVEPLHQVAPSRELVNLVQHQEPLASGHPAAKQIRTNSRVVPVQVSGVPPPRRAQQRQREGRLADLSRPTEKDHLATEIVLDWRTEVTVERLRPARHGTVPARRIRLREEFENNSELLMSKIEWTRKYTSNFSGHSVTYGATPNHQPSADTARLPVPRNAPMSRPSRANWRLRTDTAGVSRPEWRGTVGNSIRVYICPSAVRIRDVSPSS